MEERMLAELDRLAEASAALEPGPEQRRSWAELLFNHTDRYIDRLPEARAFSNRRDAVHDLSIDGEAHSLEELLAAYSEDVEGRGLNPASGGHLGYIPGGGIFTASLADYLAAITNEYAGIYFASPGAVTIEHEVINWLKRVFGFPESAVGNLPSGGSIANLIALTAARDHHGIKNERVTTAVIYLSEQVHHCIYKALRIIGLGDATVRFVRLDEVHRMDAGHLRELISADRAAGLHPFMLIASAGTTDTGAIDPLDSLADIADDEGMWMHVDAAYGGFFILLEEQQYKFRGIEKADSLVVDPHKGLFLPYGVGAVLVKNREAVLQSQHYVANYMQDAFKEDLPLNPADLSPELTKHFRGLRVWLPLKMHGIEPFQACLREKIVLTAYFRHRLKALGFELGPEPELSVSYFWYPRKTVTDQNDFNRSLLEKIHRDGRVFLSSTMLGDRFVIRMAILAFRTKKATVDRAVDMVADALEACRKEYRSSDVSECG